MSASPRVQELSSQNAKLSERLAVICKENSNLTAEVSSLQNKVAELTKAPFQKDSVLSQMFDQEKAAGWFSSSKNGAKEQLQKLCDALQKEYVEYKTTHTHSDKEMETYMKKLQAAQNKSAELASLLREQNGGDGDLKNLQRQLEEKKSEVSRLQKELQTQRMAGSGGGTGSSASGGGGASLTELRQARDEAERLKQELEAVKTALATQEGLHSMKAKESEELQRKMDVLRTQHREEILALKKKDEEGKKKPERV